MILKKQQGFTLVELLIVMFMLGMVMMALYSIYTTHQRTANISDEVVEVQQNMRIAMDSISRDVRMAGFLIPLTTCAGTNLYSLQTDTTLTNANTITLNAASASYIVSRITDSQHAAGTLGTFQVDPPESVDSFTAGDIVTIVRSQNKSLPAGYTGCNPCTFIIGTTSKIPSATITLVTNNCGALPASVVFKPDDIIVRADGGVYPSTIMYSLGPGATCPIGQLCLIRTVNGTPNTIAQNISSLNFSYLLTKDASGFPESSAPVVEDIKKVRAVRVTLIGQTAVTTALTGSVPKQRQMQSVIAIRNR